MNAQQVHAQQKALIVASLLLADTRSERHGVYAKRAKRPKRAAWAMPSVNEKKL